MSNSNSYWKLRSTEIEKGQKELLCAKVWAYPAFRMTSKSLVAAGRGEEFQSVCSPVEFPLFFLKHWGCMWHTLVFPIDVSGNFPPSSTIEFDVSVS